MATANASDAKPSNPKSHELVFSAVDKVAGLSQFLGRSIELAGNVAGYAMWCKARGISAPRFLHRERLWTSAVFPRLDKQLTVFEFGVAAGHATRYWLEALPNPDLRWHGFDTFTGLPESWRRGGVEFSAQGRFDAQGSPPGVHGDPRVTWHVGLAEETLPKVEIPDEGQLCLLLDLDLYAPTAFVLDHFAARLRPGDLLYFDEIYDPWHERRALDEYLDAGHRLTPIGSTGMSAAFAIA
jgi:hypothetical protein